MRSLTLLSIGVTLAGLAWPVEAQNGATRPLEIRLATGTPLERMAQEQLERLLTTWDLSRWLFTRSVHIQSRVIPFSHPVLTLNTQYLSDDTAQLAVFLHEQLHWFLERQKTATESAIADLARLYPQAPDGPPGGARNRSSTHLHLLVCLLEFDAIRDLLDEATARRTLGAWDHYTWIYREVLERPAPVRQILSRYSLDAPDARQ